VAVRQALTALGHHPHYRLAIVSGRSLADLQQRVAGQALYLAGNHGLEIVGPGVTYCHPEAERYRPQVQALVPELQQALDGIPGAWVENKGLTLTVHFRAVTTASVPLVHHHVYRLVRPALAAQGLVLKSGKAVLEIRPAVKWNKGAAVHWILAHMDRAAPRAFPIYIGDDDTDEDAFQALHSSGLGIVVGFRPQSTAQYFIESVEQTALLLAVLSSLTWPATGSVAAGEGE
jgi:trehalose 6-phosphate phosphatase